MAQVQFADDAREIMEQFVASFPEAIKESYKTKILKGVEYQLLKKGLDVASKDIFIDALYEIFPKSFDPLLLRFKDPQKLKSMMEEQKKVDEANPLIKVRRWKVPPVQADKPIKKIVALMASPRKGGSTDCIMDALLNGVSESGGTVEKLYFSDLTISPCIGCMACEEKELKTYCAVKDDMTELYSKFLGCDAFVMGFPVYTARECAQAAIFFDRLKALRTKAHMPKLLNKRKGALIVTWGWPTEDSYEHVAQNAVFVLRLFGVHMAEVIVGCGFWEAYYKKGTAKLDIQGMEQAKEAGRVLVSGS
jgi:multimeric flavodoxin WrbA